MKPAAFYARLALSVFMIIGFISLCIHPIQAADEPFHSADGNPADHSVSLSELLRVVQLYNNYAYHCSPGSEDGYAPGTGGHSCLRHDTDYNPGDWRIELGELLRMIQLYNTGTYHSAADSEDGFRPGPLGSLTALEITPEDTLP